MNRRLLDDDRVADANVLALIWSACAGCAALAMVERAS